MRPSELKALNGEELEEYELEALIDFNSIDTIEGEDHRWDREMISIVQIGDRYFAIPWRKGLTEMQYNSYHWQPFEVFLHQEEKTIVVSEWKDKDNNSIKFK